MTGLFSLFKAMQNKNKIKFILTIAIFAVVLFLPKDGLAAVDVIEKGTVIISGEAKGNEELIAEGCESEIDGPGPWSQPLTDGHGEAEADPQH